MYGWYVDFLRYRLCDDILIMQNKHTTDAYEKYLRIQLTAANLEFNVSRDEKLLTTLDMHTLSKSKEWKKWDDMKLDSCRTLVNRIIEKQKEIISITNNYPMKRTEKLCRLPPSVQASSEYNNPAMIKNNGLQLVYLYRSIQELQQTTFNAYFVDARKILSSTSITPFVQDKPFTYDLGVRLDRIKGNSKLLLMYDLILSSEQPTFRLNIDKELFEQNFLTNFTDLSKKFNRLIVPQSFRPIRKRRISSISQASESSSDSMDQPSSVFSFREQSRTLYFDNPIQYSNYSRGATNTFAIRVIQTTYICMMERYMPDKLQQLLEKPIFYQQYQLISNFINAIYSRLVAAYAKGELRSIINLRYIRPDEIGNGKISKQIRKLNNVLIFGPLLKTD